MALWREEPKDLMWEASVKLLQTEAGMAVADGKRAVRLLPMLPMSVAMSPMSEPMPPMPEVLVYVSISILGVDSHSCICQGKGDIRLINDIALLLLWGSDNCGSREEEDGESLELHLDGWKRIGGFVGRQWYLVFENMML